MVCIPCIVVPVLLFIWHRFIYPIVSRFWDPFGSKKRIDANKDGSKSIEKDSDSAADKANGEQNGLKCPFSSSSEKETLTTGEIDNLDTKKTIIGETNAMSTKSDDPDIVPVKATGVNTLPKIIMPTKDNDEEIKPIQTGEPSKELEPRKTEIKTAEEFPTTLEGFGYHFVDDRLRNISTGGPFEFVVKKDDRSYNQRRYEALGAVITEEIYKLLEERCKLEKIYIPVGATKETASNFIFVSKDYDKKEKLLILIHGSGRVRAGQWAQRLIINDSLDSGSQIPFIERGLLEDYGILVMNPNENNKPCRKGLNVPFIGMCGLGPINHGKYVWEKVVRPCQSRKIFIVAHSRGGNIATKLFFSFRKDFAKRIVAVALTDSSHNILDTKDDYDFIKIARNWIASSEPLDTYDSDRSIEIPCVSAGCVEHERTSWSSFESIFDFFNENLMMAEAVRSELDSLKARNSKKAKLLDLDAIEDSIPIPELPVVDVDVLLKVGENPSLYRGMKPVYLPRSAPSSDGCAAPTEGDIQEEPSLSVAETIDDKHHQMSPSDTSSDGTQE